MPGDTFSRLLDAHSPSMSSADEREIDLRATRGDDASWLALRTCACGRRLDGFDEYVAHLRETLVAENA